MSLLGAVISVPEAKAVCLPPPIPNANNCLTFDQTGTTTPTFTYVDANLNSNGFWQLTSNYGAITQFNISTKGLTNIAWTPVGGAFVSQVFTPASNPSAPILSPVSFTFEIPDGLVPIGGDYDLQLSSNNNDQRVAMTGDLVLDGNLATNPNGNTYSVSRASIRVDDPVIPPPTDAVPGPLPLLGAGAAFGFSRRLRSRVNAARQVA